MEVESKKVTMKELNTLAKNSEALKDTVVYRGFVDSSLDPEVTYNYDDTLVMITPLGEFKGSGPDGKPTKEIIDEESIKLMASQTEEILLDKDHASMRPVEERNTEAMGWISGLKAVTNLGDMSGLYGVIKWAGEGLRLAKERIYRFLSPVFELDENGKAIKLVNVALTNRPALKMPPIINGEANGQDENTSITQTQKDTDTMNKEEIEQMIKDLVKQEVANSKPAEETKVEVTNSEAKEEEKVEVTNSEAKEEEKKSEEQKEETKEEEVKNGCEETKEDEVKNEEETKKEEVKNGQEETKEEEKKEEEKKEEEVIKAEVLNSSAVTLGTSVNSMEAWRNLHGKEFFDYLKTHKV